METGSDLWHQFETLLKQKDVAGAASLFASDGVHVSPIGRREGLEAIRAFWEEVGQGTSDIDMTTSLLLEDGDIVVAEWTYRATFVWPATMPDVTATASGKTRALAGVSIVTMRDGKFAVMRDYYDTANANGTSRADL
jgi:ketosteroid isomerase-like protein